MNKTQFLLNNFEWDAEETKILETIGYEPIAEKIYNLPDKEYYKLIDYFQKWLMGEAPKARLNYWLKKTCVTEKELNIWMTL